MHRWIHSALSGIFGYVVVSTALMNALSHSNSSTIGIGIFLMPFVALPFSMPFLVFGFCVGDLVEVVRRSLRQHSAYTKVRATLALVLTIAGIGYVISGVGLSFVVSGIRNMSERELEAFVTTSVFRNNKFALGAVAENPNASERILDRIARMSNSELDLPMFSVWPILGRNVDGWPVRRLLAMNQNISRESLILLANNPNELVRSTVAQNPKTPVVVLRELLERDEFPTSAALAANPNAPADILRKVAKSTSKYTRSFVATNLNTPEDVLSQSAHDAEWTVRRDVALNPNTPMTIIRLLAKDSHQSVRSQARTRLDK